MKDLREFGVLKAAHKVSVDLQKHMPHLKGRKKKNRGLVSTSFSLVRGEVVSEEESWVISLV